MSGDREESFDDIMARLQAGDEQAAREVFERFASRLVALAHTRLPKYVRAKEDPEDVVQSAFESFFRRHAAGEYVLINWDSLWGLMALMTIRKCGHHTEYYSAELRDVRREFHFAPLTDDSRSSWEVLAHEPTPSHAAMFTEMFERLIASLDERERQILALHLQDYTTEEISAEVRRSERTVQRTLENIRRRIEQMQK
jgi:RNA polymerase sigma-70 factor, ECF subfamily